MFYVNCLGYTLTCLWPIDAWRLGTWGWRIWMRRMYFWIHEISYYFTLTNICIKGNAAIKNYTKTINYTWIKYSKLLFNSRNYTKIFREIKKKVHVEKDSFNWFQTTLYIGYKLLSSVLWSSKLLLGHSMSNQHT